MVNSHPLTPTSAHRYFSVRTAGFEPTISSSPNWRDNQTSLRSDASNPYGSRTHLSADQRCASVPEERYPAPIDERAVLSCCCVRAPYTQWAHEALESSSPALQAGARPSQLPVRVLLLDESTKKARCRWDTGLCVIRKSTAECHKRNGRDGAIFACS